MLDGGVARVGDRPSFRWYVYPEAGSYHGTATIQQATEPDAVLEAPADAAGKSLHVILEMTDSGVPPLTRYRRIMVTGK